MPHPPFQACIGKPFIELPSVDSTNNYALEQVHAGLARHGTAFFAREQVAGKGQRGKTWTAARDSSLLLSIVIDPRPLEAARQFQLSACIAVSVYEFFQAYAGDATKIKWPNDLYWHDRKAGGILIENIIGAVKKITDDGMGMTDPLSVIGHPSPGWQWAIAGIGINLNQPAFPDALKNPVSLRQITGQEFDPLVMAKKLCAILEKNFRVLYTNGFGPIDRIYQASLYKKNQPVRFRKGTRTFEAIVKSVSPAGQLVVQHGIEEELAWGEAEWLIPASPGGDSPLSPNTPQNNIP